MAPSIVTRLANSHICRNFPRALIYAPAANLGAGIPNLFTVQGIKHLESMMAAGKALSLTGKLLRASFEAFLTECGVGRTMCNPKWSKVVSDKTISWIRETIIFLQSNNLELRHDIEISTSCNNAIFLMAYCAKQQANEATLVKLNGCRL
jgi:hypothetical protein